MIGGMGDAANLVPQDDSVDPLFAMHSNAVQLGVDSIRNSPDPKKAAIRAAKEAKKMGIGDQNELDAIISGKKDPFDYSFGAGPKGEMAMQVPPQPENPWSNTQLPQPAQDPNLSLSGGDRTTAFGKPENLKGPLEPQQQPNIDDLLAAYDKKKAGQGTPSRDMGDMGQPVTNNYSTTTVTPAQGLTQQDLDSALQKKDEEHKSQIDDLLAAYDKKQKESKPDDTMAWYKGENQTPHKAPVGGGAESQESKDHEDWFYGQGPSPWNDIKREKKEEQEKESQGGGSWRPMNSEKSAYYGYGQEPQETTKEAQGGAGGGQGKAVNTKEAQGGAGGGQGKVVARSADNGGGGQGEGPGEGQGKGQGYGTGSGGTGPGQGAGNGTGNGQGEGQGQGKGAGRYGMGSGQGEYGTRSGTGQKPGQGPGMAQPGQTGQPAPGQQPPPTQGSLLAMVANRDQNQDPLAMPENDRSPATATPPKVVSKRPNAGAEDLQKFWDKMQADPELMAIKKGNQDLAENTPKLIGQQSDHAWIQPVAALADYVSRQSGNQGSAQLGVKNLIGIPPSEQANLLLKYQDEAQKRKEDLYKTQMNALMGYGRGQGNVTVTTGGPEAGAGLTKRTLMTQASAAGKQYDNDKMLLGFETGFNNFDKFQGMMDGKTPIDSSKYNVMQEELTRAMLAGQNGGGQVADARVVRDQIDSVFAKWNKVETSLKKDGKIPDMRKDAPALFTQLQSYKDQLRQDFEDQYSQRVEQLRHNYDQTSMIAGAPEIAQASYDKADKLLKARITGGKSLHTAKIPGAKEDDGSIEMSDGKETRLVPKKHQKDAEADGFKAVH